MTAPSGRVYPVKVPKRDLELHRLSLAALNAVPRTDLAIVENTRTALKHRIACAERWEEARAKRLSWQEVFIAREALLGGVVGAWLVGNADRARVTARVLVRVTRDVRTPARLEP